MGARDDDSTPTGLPNSRDELIDDVLRGRIEPQKAEEIAAERGYGPLSRAPPAEAFDLLREPWWALPVAVAWINWRTLKQACDYWDDYRAECLVWTFCNWRLVDGPTYEGFKLQPRSPAKLSTMSMASISERPAGSRYGPTGFDRAISELWLALGDGLLEASARNSETGRQLNIPAHEWAVLKWYERQALEPVYVAKGPLEPGYEAVRLRGASLIALWPPIGPILDTLPPTVPPIGPGYLPIYCGAQWIATEGGTRVFDAADRSMWKRAFDELLPHLAAGDVQVTGLKDGVREDIPGRVFIGIDVDYPFATDPLALRRTDELTLRSYPYVNEEQWRAGFDDSLWGRNGVKWSRLMVSKAEISRLWPFGLIDADLGAVPQRSGAPGRPSSMHLVEAEYKRRCGTGDAKAVLREEAEELSKWLRQAHPHAPPVTSGTIANRIRYEHRQRFGSSRK